MMPDDDVHMITPAQQIISSTIGALTTSIFVTPLDVVKIRLQAQQKNFYKNKCFLYCNGLMEHLCYCVNGNNGAAHIHHKNGSTHPIDPRDIKWYKRPIPGHFTGTFDALIKISRAEGITSLWSGLPPTLLMAIPATVIYFTAYDRLRANLWSWSKTDHQPIWIPVVCGATARCIAATTISPLEMVRTKMQSKKLTYLEVATAVKQLVKYEGPLSLWRGLGPTLLRDVPFSSIYWAGYEFMKQRFDQRKPTLQFSLSAGALAGSIAAITTLPFDVAKTHRQIELGERDLIDPSKRQGSDANNHRTTKILRKIYKQSGVPGLFSGIVPRVIKVAPSCAIMISCYEFGKQFFVKYNSEKARRKER
uniref:Solute carrier family 25 member 40 n=1 Tax=Aceria tosichella TaxID=561515 RepID=A0A6G1SA08_9ACAR